MSALWPRPFTPSQLWPATGVSAGKLISTMANWLRLQQARAAAGDAPPEPVQRELDYLERNRQRMDYGVYRRQGLFIGSGVVEAGCKRIIGQRLKQSGMFWCEQG